MPETKAILLVADGLGDRPISALGGYTPLESARKPVWNLLAERGITGLLDPLGVGIRPSSDTATMALLGYDPKEIQTNRGPLEALGAGITLKPGDVALRTNLATRNANGRLIDRRAGRIKETAELELALNRITLSNGVKAYYKSGVEHRGVLVLRANGLSPNVSDSDPAELNQKPRKPTPKDSTEEARNTAAALNEYLTKANALLEKTPLNKKRAKNNLPRANTLICRSAGSPPNWQGFNEKWGFKAACVAGSLLEKGIARAAGMQVIPVKGATGRSDTDLYGKFQASSKALGEGFDFVFTHVKASDSFGHDGDPEGKKNFIQRVDAAISLWQNLQDTLIITTADHSTPCDLRNHSGDPVPVMMSGPGVRKDGVRQFGERECARGGLGRIKGLDLMPEIANICGRSRLNGS